MPTRQSQADFEQTLIDTLKRKNVAETITNIILETVTSALNDKFKYYDEKIAQLEAEIVNLKTNFNESTGMSKEGGQKTMEQKLDNIQQHMKSNNLRLIQIPEAEGEILTDKLYDIFTNKMNVNINKSEITAVYRVGRRNDTKPRHVLVSFTDNSIKMATYNKFDRSTRGGGVGLYIDSKLKYSQIEVSHNVEQLWVSVSLKGKSYADGVVYRPPHFNYKYFIDELEESLCVAMLREDKVICLGDVNINFLDTEAAPTNYMLEMLDSTGIEQIVEEATHITNTSATLIDVILCNDPLMIESKHVGGLDLTDHELISCKALQDRQKIEPLFYTYRSFRSLEMDKLHADLQNLPLIDICYLSNIDEKVNLFNHSILTLFDKHIPLKTSKITKPKAPWLKDDIRNLMRSRDAARSKYRKNPNDSNWNAYKKLKTKPIMLFYMKKESILIKLLRSCLARA
ncbi:unnamed protein product [Acanthoscelides obtectus]|uniref:Endonuclease/exonuclease/phosphatase domain-containing protein n=1 Tax=Acanthoscelides obtectus TaxID=200917 RepID=A0A9P0P4L0_ACAOB|nr:unnamed protein product [Acanthoscelides obtectus]CAK1642985.1 hypothetical protein AOBTE_LOCUS13338 [Acanthoscelides obtectus]